MPVAWLIRSAYPYCGATETPILAAWSWRADYSFACIYPSRGSLSNRRTGYGADGREPPTLINKSERSLSAGCQRALRSITVCSSGYIWLAASVLERPGLLMPVTASGAAFAMFLPLMFCDVYACKAFIYALSGRLLRMSTVLFASSGPLLASPAPPISPFARSWLAVAIYSHQLVIRYLR